MVDVGEAAPGSTAPVVAFENAGGDGEYTGDGGEYTGDGGEAFTSPGTAGEAVATA